MSQETFEPVFVLLCDWRGHVVWTSQQVNPASVGDVAWKRLAPESQELAKESLARAASLRLSQNFCVVHQNGKYCRCWVWPLDTPEIAVCVLCQEIPKNLSSLTDREMECMQFLAHGLPIREIAEQLDVSTSTLHTHLTRARAKLEVDSLEGLISFAARYCYPPSKPLIPETGT